MGEKNNPGKNKQIHPVKNPNKKNNPQWIILFILLVTFLAYILSNSIGVSYQKMKKYQESILNFNKAIEVGHNPVFYLNRSYSYFALQNMELAKKDALTAKQGGVQIS